MLFGLGPDAYSWRGVGLLCGVYFGAMVFAAVLSPAVFHAAGWWVDTFPGWWNRWLEGRTDFGDFPRHFDRLRWVPVVLLFPFLLNACGLLSWRALGLRFGREDGELFWRGMIGGCALVGVLMLFQLAFVTVTIDARYAYGGEYDAMLWILPGALILSLVEEIVFRGFIFRIFYSALRPVTAIVVSAVVFAYLHYKMPPDVWREIGDAVGWLSGFQVAWGTLTGIAHDFSAVPFFTLVLVGILLNLVFLRTGSLLACIGVHAGIVWLRMAYDKTHNTPLAEHAWFFGTAALNDGLLTLLLLGLAVWYLLWEVRQYERYRRNQSQ